MVDQFYMTSPAARAAGISESTLRLWARIGLVPSIVTSSNVRLFRLEDVLRVAQARPRAGKAPMVVLVQS